MEILFFVIAVIGCVWAVNLLRGRFKETRTERSALLERTHTLVRENRELRSLIVENDMIIVTAYQNSPAENEGRTFEHWKNEHIEYYKKIRDL